MSSLFSILRLLARQSEGGALAFLLLARSSLRRVGFVLLQVGPTSFEGLIRMLAAEQGSIHDDPGSVETSVDRTLRKFFLHDPPYGGKSVSIYYRICRLSVRDPVLPVDRDQDEEERGQAEQIDRSAFLGRNVGEREDCLPQTQSAKARNSWSRDRLQYRRKNSPQTATFATRVDAKQYFFRKRKPIVALM